MFQEQNSSKQELEEELGQLLLSLLSSGSDAERQRCLPFIESTLRRLIVLKGDSHLELE